ncbi:MAG: nickel-dependent lactate racemase [Bacteroidales bacterium]|nr:nickel-dependent lactate racemase [Bacteroidales bacterium]
MVTTFKYGKEKIELNIPEKAEFLKVREADRTIEKSKFLSDLEAVLPEGDDFYSHVGVVIADKTRLCGYPMYLPWLLEILESRGAKKDNISFYIAYGTHPKQTEEESINSYGETFKTHRFVHHDCYDEAALVLLGTTARGTSVKVRRDAVESSLLITFGAISHHYFAGYGGGRKLIFPGLADRKSVYHNHGLFLDREKKELAAGCQPGKLEGNPLAEDLREIDSWLPGKISIHGILNAQGEVVQLHVGETYDDFLKACSIHDSYYRSGLEKQYDMVIASTGGYPKDINFIQAHKSVHHAAAFVRDGGKLIIITECIDGIASNYFLKYLEAGSFEKAYDMLADNYEGNGGTALSMMAKTNRISIYMMTSLDDQLCKTLNVIRVDIKGVQDLLNGEDGTIATIENASLLVR